MARPRGYRRRPVSLSGLTDPHHTSQDFAFLLNHIITFSFIRQFATLHVLRPLALEIGIRGSKVLRFQEQSYCMVYWGISGLFGVVNRSARPPWAWTMS